MKLLVILFLINAPPVLTTEISVFGVESESTEIICEMGANPRLIITWAKLDGGTANTFTTSETVTYYAVFDVTSTLTIATTELEHYGTYNCKGVNQYWTLEKNFKLIVNFYGKPNTTTTITLSEGDALSLQVPAFYSNPYSEFSFLFNGTLITAGHTLSNTTNSTTIFKTRQAGSLTKAAVDHTNSGVYEIKACNLIGCKTDQWRVVVKFKPVLTTTIPAVTHVNETNTLELECTFIGNPTPNAIVWKHNEATMSAGGDIAISHSTLHTGEFSSSVTSTLTVSNVGKTAGNKYECSASNNNGSAVGTYNVSVCHAPVIVTDYTNTVQRVAEGAALLPLNFVVESNPVSSFIFHKDGVKMAVTPSLSNLNQPDPYWYIVRQTAKPYSTTASREMSGQYNVTACNNLGCVTSKTTTVIVDYAPVIVTDYTNTVRRVTEGAALLPLNFVVESNLVSSFTFYKDGVIMTVTPSPSTLNQPDISWYIVRQTAKPYSTTASREMSGQYNVTACNSFGCVTSNTTTMIVEYIPKIQPIANVNVNQGINATLQCVVDGEPAPISVQWFFNNTGPIANSTTDHAINSVTTTFAYHTGVTSDLTIYDVQRLPDVGLYTCNTSNTMGQSEESANLTVASAPIEVNAPNNITVNEGFPFNLVYLVRGVPEVAFNWTLNGTKVEGPSPLPSTSEAVTQSTLFNIYKSSTLSSVSALPEQGGVYKVMAYNEHGVVSHEVNVIVNYAPRISTIENATEIITVSGPQYIQCDVDSNPALTPSDVQWYKNGTLITDTPSDNYVISTTNVSKSIFRKKVTSRLEFVTASKADSGKYSCKATNSVGSKEFETEMIVYFVPYFDPPQKTVVVTAGNSATINCSALANPTPTYMWELPSGTTTIGDSLTINSTTVSMSGLYNCSASNNLGTSASPFVVNLIVSNPIMAKFEGDSYIALYLIVPLALVLAVVGLVWLVKRPRTSIAPLIVPLASNTLPPNAGALGAPNNGLQPDTEAIEVFDKGNGIPNPDDVDTVDRPLTPKSVTMDIDSVHGTVNLYQKMENNMVLM